MHAIFRLAEIRARRAHAVGESGDDHRRECEMLLIARHSGFRDRFEAPVLFNPAIP